MITVDLYSKSGCHLCDIVKDILIKIRESHPFELHEIMIQQGDQHFEQFKDRIPVVYINNNFAFQHRINEKDFLKRLQEESSTAT